MFTTLTLHTLYIVSEDLLNVIIHFRIGRLTECHYSFPYRQTYRISLLISVSEDLLNNITYFLITRLTESHYSFPHTGSCKPSKKVGA